MSKIWLALAAAAMVFATGCKFAGFKAFGVFSNREVGTPVESGMEAELEKDGAE